jgi:lycopene cyclase domain-containing protein
LALLFYERIYSLVSFSLTALFILLTEWFMKAPFLLRFYRAYLIILIPFIIVNGFLTGTGLEQPVVWYNQAENMNLRLFTIPLEDGVYGFLLIGVNIFLLEHFTKMRRKTSPSHKQTPAPTTP